MKNSIKFDTPARRAAYDDMVRYKEQILSIRQMKREREQRFADTVYGKILELILQKPMTAKEISEAMHGDVTPQQVSTWLTKNIGTQRFHHDPVFECTINTKSIIQRVNKRHDLIHISYTKNYRDVDYVKLDENGNPDFNRQLHRKERIGGTWSAFTRASR